MNSKRIGWNFPPTNGGIGAGFNDSGVAHFGGTPMISLAREAIQNSLDARDTLTDPVNVSFELLKVKNKKAFGCDELHRTIESCLREVFDGSDEKAKMALSAAEKILRERTLTFLRVSDRNTKGLHGAHWATLVKKQGISVKDTEDAGGSHGIGKNAPFAISPLRTVFYWSRFEREGEVVEQFQGKAVLMSHKGSDGAETQGTGFFGLKEKCLEITGKKIPEDVQRVERAEHRGKGTSLWIAGFSGRPGWQKRIACSVIENFLCAINDGKLTVTIEPDEEQQESELLEIKKDTLKDWFSYLLRHCARDQKDGLLETRAFWDLLTQKVPHQVKELPDPDLGRCRLLICVGEKFPSKVALVRQTGMLITSQQKGLMRFRRVQDFCALCLFEDPSGNALLRDMENPQHNQFEPERLAADRVEHGSRVLSRVVNWIRDEIQKYASPPEMTQTSALDELEDLLPSLEPDDAFGPPRKNKGEQSLGATQAEIRLRPRRLQRFSPDIEGDAEGIEDGPGDDGGGTTGGGGGEHGDGHGPGDGDGTGGTGNTGTGDEPKPERPFLLEDVRFIPLPKQEERCRLSLTPGDTGKVRLRMRECGDSMLETRDDLMVLVDGEKKSLATTRFWLEKGKRASFDIAGGQPITKCAWSIEAFTENRGRSK